MTETSRNQNLETTEPHWVEWLTGLISGLLVLGLIGWVCYEAMTQDPKSPDLVAIIGSETATESGRRVEFKIVNRSDKTAAAVAVKGELVENGTVLESHDVVLDYVPAQSTARGAIIFSSDATSRQIRIRPAGYAEP